VYKTYPRDRLSTPVPDDYHREGHQVDEVFQEKELPSSFDIDPAPTLDSLGGDLNDISLPQKRKRAITLDSLGEDLNDTLLPQKRKR